MPVRDRIVNSLVDGSYPIFFVVYSIIPNIRSFLNEKARKYRIFSTFPCFLCSHFSQSLNDINKGFTECQDLSIRVIFNRVYGKSECYSNSIYLPIKEGLTINVSALEIAYLRFATVKRLENNGSGSYTIVTEDEGVIGNSCVAHFKIV